MSHFKQEPIKSFTHTKFFKYILTDLKTCTKRKPSKPAGKYGCFGKADVQDLLSKYKKPCNCRVLQLQKNRIIFLLNSSFSPRFFFPIIEDTSPVADLFTQEINSGLQKK